MKYENLFSWKNLKENISKCRQSKPLPRVLSMKLKQLLQQCMARFLRYAFLKNHSTLVIDKIIQKYNSIVVKKMLGKNHNHRA